MTRILPNNPLIAILGATGTGKSKLAVSLAKRYNGEIINGDAMQLYTGLPIITNKVTKEEQQGIPHHLLGCIGLEEQTWVVGKFVQKAQKVIEEIRGRGKLPILVGGTHYYTQSLLFRDQLADEVGQDAPKFVEDTKKQWPVLNEPTDVLLEELRKVDPVMADRWHPNDRRKIQRSLEIHLQTGRKASDIYAEQRERKSGVDIAGDAIHEGLPLRSATLLLWVHADTEILKARLDMRVDKMFDTGLLHEVQTLEAFAESQSALGKNVDDTRGIWVSIGYKEFRPYSQALKAAVKDHKELEQLKLDALEKTKIATRQYAKRQLRWIRIKLVNALHQADASRNLFLLDGSDLSEFDSNVETPALNFTQLFLQGIPLPRPASSSNVAAEMLTPKRDYDLASTPEKWIRQRCEVCCVTCVTQEQWHMHTKSKSHRKLVSKRKNTQLEAKDLPSMGIPKAEMQEWRRESNG